MKNTCCVPNCESRRSRVKLHRFPKTEIGLKWVMNINCAKLKDLSPVELHKLFVCHKHFEKRFVTERCRLRVNAYPTLFTYDELKTGITVLACDDFDIKRINREHDYTQQRKRKHEDHLYTQQQPEYDLPTTSKKFALDMNQGTASDHTDQTHSCSLVTKESSTVCDGNKILTSTICDGDETITSAASGGNKTLQKLNPEYTGTPKKKLKRFVIRKNQLTPRCHIILKEYKKAKKQLNFATRVKKALQFSKKHKFDKMTSKLNPLAQKILWMQISQCTKEKKGRRFTDEEKIIALAIMKQSPKSYKFLRKIFILPSIRTLNKMTSNLQVDAGINSQIFNAIEEEVKNWQKSKKYCSVIFDEVALEPGVTYNQHTDDIVGFVELDSKTNKYADHALVFMIRGAVHKWQQPICYYYCEGATSAQTLKKILIQVISEVIRTGLIPVALISDQGTAFQSAINKLKEDTRKQQILADQPVDDTIQINGQKMYVIYDPPHLLKGLRNNFLSKDIKYNGKISKWSDILDVYLTDCRHSEMRLLHKLNDETVIPEKIKKMKVKNCTRVFSKTVASALTYTAQFSRYVDGREVSHTLSNTAEIVTFFDDLFDSCNGATLSCKNKGKPLRQAVTKTSSHEAFWTESIKMLQEMRFINKEGKEIIVPSLKNYITTLRSLCGLWQFFKNEGLKIMRPRYFNSDPIENFFGQVRAYSFRNNDPTCHSFKYIFRSLLITRFINFHSESFNCEDASGEQLLKLKKIFMQTKEKKEIGVASCERIMPPEDIKDNQAEARQERVNVHSRAYTAGWVIRKCLKKIKCKECKKSLTQKEESCTHNWIKCKEYKTCKNKTKLTYPAENAVRSFTEIVKKANEYLETKPNSSNLSKEISNEIISKYSFAFLKCELHRKVLIEYFINITIKLTIINWCNIINKILKGNDVIRLKKQLPLMQQNALIKYKKKIKNKKHNKYSYVLFTTS